MSDPTGGLTPQTTAAARFARVARMLLFPAVICVVPLMSACILPIAPEFQDPTAAQNYPPFFITTEPEIGAVVATPTFRVTVSDPNVGDDLHVRWLANYPPQTADTRPITAPGTISHAANGLPLFADSTVTAQCFVDLVPGLTRHRIMVVIADRDFLPAVRPGSTEVDFACIPDDGHKVVASWTLDLPCAPPKASP